jgi:hypothetical protein
VRPWDAQSARFLRFASDYRSWGSWRARCQCDSNSSAVISIPGRSGSNRSIMGGLKGQSSGPLLMAMPFLGEFHLAHPAAVRADLHQVDRRVHVVVAVPPPPQIHHAAIGQRAEAGTGALRVG